MDSPKRLARNRSAGGRLGRVHFHPRVGEERTGRGAAGEAVGLPAASSITGVCSACASQFVGGALSRDFGGLLRGESGGEEKKARHAELITFPGRVFLACPIISCVN